MKHMWHKILFFVALLSQYTSISSCVSFATYERDMRHALSLVNRIQYLDAKKELFRILSYVEDSFGKCDHRYQEVTLCLALVLSKLEYYKEALLFAKQVRDNSECPIKTTDLVYTQAMLVLGLIYTQLGENKIAHQYLIGATSISPIRNATDDILITIAQAYELLVRSAIERKQIEEAKNLYMKLYMLGSSQPNNKKLAKYIHYTNARLLISLGRYSNAEKELLGYSLFEEGDLADIERMNRTALLAMAIVSQGKAREALRIINDVEMSDKNRYCRKCCARIDLIEVKAFVNDKLGNHADAYKDLKVARMIVASCYGSMHTKIAEIDLGIASTLYKLGRTKEALDTLVGARERVKVKLGDYHPLLMPILDGIANIRRANGDIRGAMDSLNALLAIQKKVIGEHSIEVKDTIAKIRWCMRQERESN